MTSNPSLRRLRLVVALALLPAAAPRVAAQSSGLRLGGDPGGLPGSPASAPVASPEAVASPPRITASPSDADVLAPPSTTTNAEDNGAPNYGKPRRPRPKLYKPNPKTSPPLSPLAPYRDSRGQRRAATPASTPPIDVVEPAPTVAAIPTLPRPVRRPIEADPYLPSGVDVGPLRLRPYVELTSGYETNPNQVQVGVRPSAALRADGGFDLTSDFSRHSLTASLRGGYSDFPSNSAANRPDANGIVDGRIDVTRDDRIDLEGRFSLATQTPGSPLLAVANSAYTVNRPLIATEGATLGGTHAFNRLSVGLRGTFDRVQYGDGTQSNGTTVLYSQDNYNDYGIVGRVSYELTPSIVPFAEVAYDARVRDNPVDLSGYYRNSTGILGRAGSTFDFVGHFTGTFSAGYADRSYADGRLANLHGPVIAGQLVYAFSPLTTFTVGATTTLSETTLAGSSGALTRSFNAQVTHQFFRNFAVTAAAIYQPNQYQGLALTETLTSFSLKGTYSVSRDVQLIATASRQHLSSPLVGNNFTDTIFLAGVRLQR